MFTKEQKTAIAARYDAAMKQITQKNIGCFKGHSKPLYLISEEYPGVWLEHA